jgi:hypothetical protein
MATFKSPTAFADEVGKMERTLVRDQQKATRRMAEVMAGHARVEAGRDLGGDTRFSGWTPGPNLADLRIRRARSGVGTLLTPTRTSAGGWTVAQFGRNKGDSGQFQGPALNRRTGARAFTKTGKVRRFKAGRWNGYTQGKGTADRAFRSSERDVGKIADRAMRTAVLKHFD